ncbi:hypothetical protein LTR36_002540 [Oleoguttula mirabilis]|uniref:NAD(P)-binding domain-containing protein n=1 Tax=Oleoguttula mirabilis TaxID=1507867 RepID=A0AAV9JL41_9PEZI|nr:hypothetical protein LTR36_002540 [Oleoguttula mirabilis]
MKIILAGSTGFIGSAVLQRCIAHPSITFIVALSRRELSVKHAKLRTIIQPDFLHYPPEILSQLEGAEACIWSLGTPRAGRDGHVDYTLAAVHAFASALATELEAQGSRFRFVYLSGAVTERDQNKSLWFLGESRKMRGGVETALAEFERENADAWKSVVSRPSLVMTGEWVALKYLIPAWYIPVEELAAALVDVAVSGDGPVFVENAELRERGSRALQAAP